MQSLKRVTRSYAIFHRDFVGQPTPKNRDVAQPGSALAWGARGREFESRHPDQEKAQRLASGFFYAANPNEF